MEDKNYLLAALEASVKECRRLENKVRELEQRLKISHSDEEHAEIQIKPKRQRKRSNRTYRPWQKKEEEEEENAPLIEIKTAHRRTTNDLYAEARERHRQQVETQERLVDEALKQKENSSVDVKISDEKKRLYVETASAIMNKNGN